LTDGSTQQDEPLGNNDPEDRLENNTNQGDQNEDSVDPTGITRGQGMKRVTTTTCQDPPDSSLDYARKNPLRLTVQFQDSQRSL